MSDLKRFEKREENKKQNPYFCGFYLLASSGYSSKVQPLLIMLYFRLCAVLLFFCALLAVNIRNRDNRIARRHPSKEIHNASTTFGSGCKCVPSWISPTHAF